jgi:hypothetical protein
MRSLNEFSKNERGGACRPFGGEETCIQGFGGETRETDHLKALDIVGRIII